MGPNSRGVVGSRSFLSVNARQLVAVPRAISFTQVFCDFWGCSLKSFVVGCLRCIVFVRGAKFLTLCVLADHTMRRTSPCCATASRIANRIQTQLSPQPVGVLAGV